MSHLFDIALTFDDGLGVAADLDVVIKDYLWKPILAFLTEHKHGFTILFHVTIDILKGDLVVALWTLEAVW